MWNAIGDSETRQVFEKILRWTTRLLHVPMAHLWLADQDDSFFHSRIPLPETPIPFWQTPSWHDVCQKICAIPSPFLTRDADSHPLLQETEVSTVLGVMGYMAIPIVSPVGTVLGHLCVLDTRPRDWSMQEVEELQGLATTVCTEIHLRDALRRTTGQTAELAILHRALQESLFAHPLTSQSIETLLAGALS